MDGARGCRAVEQREGQYRVTAPVFPGQSAERRALGALVELVIEHRELHEFLPGSIRELARQIAEACPE